MAACRAFFAKLDVTRVIWLAACCKTDILMDQCLMYPYFALQYTLAPRARSTSFVEPLGQVHARAKASCIQFKTRQGNF